MPGIRIKRRRASNGRGAKRQRTWPRTQRLVNVPNHPVTPTKYIKLRYVDQITLNPGVGSIAHHLFNANGMWDPDLSGAGHQPLGFDQYMAFYESFVVVGAKCKIQCMSGGEAVADNCYVGIYLNESTTSAANPGELLEQQNSKWAMLTNGDAGGSAAVTQYYNAARFFGSEVIGKADHTGTASGNPVEKALFNVFAFGASVTADPTILQCNVTIEYTALVTERKTLAGS